MSEAFLGIDLGTSSVKVLVVAVDGSVIGRGSASYAVHRRHPGHAEQDPDDWWRATIEATNQARAAGTAAIAAVGVTGQMHGTVTLDRAGSPLGPAIIWEDQRAHTEVQRLTETVGAGRIVEIAGSPLATGFQAATIAWLRAHDPDRWRQTAHVLLPKDEIRRRLTGELATDPSDASGTLLLDVRARTWSPELMAAVGVDILQLPPVIPSAALAGTLRSEAATALGLRAGIPVATGGGDAPCGLLGAGIIDPATMLLSFSTGAQVMVPATAVEIDLNGRMHTFCAALEPSNGHPGWYQMGATLAAGLAVRWLGEVLFALAEADLDSHLIDLAARAPLGADGLLFLPYLVGERTPHMDALARAAFAGLTARHDRATIARAVIEGVTFAAYDAFTVLAGAGANPRQIVAVGGGARSAWWRQLAADLFGLPVAFAGTADQAALGAAMLAAASQGADPLDWALRWSTTGVPLPPDPLRHQRYRDLFALYRRAAQSTIELSHDLARFADRSNRGKD